MMVAREESLPSWLAILRDTSVYGHASALDLKDAINKLRARVAVSNEVFCTWR
jgi:hypothetical protein